MGTEHELVCPSCGGANLGIGEAHTRHGRPIFPFFCLDCDCVLQRYATKAAAEAERVRLGGLPALQTKTERLIAAGHPAEVFAEALGPCVVCGSIDNIERHHWAPFHLFGAECDKWPTSPLCQPCHVRWHQIVTPNMGKPRP